MKIDAVMALQERGILPSAQRVAVAEVVLASEQHPSADQVFAGARARFPQISRATVYNTLNLLVARGLLRQLVLQEGSVVFDPNLIPHHHFIDETTGAIDDVAVGRGEGDPARQAQGLRGPRVPGGHARQARPPLNRLAFAPGRY